MWKISRVGERPQKKDLSDVNSDVMTFGYNSPFEEFAFAHQLNTLGISTVYIRAIYMTGSTKAEISEDLSRYESHNSLTFNNGKPILCKNHNYITIKGFYNGPDNHVAQQGMPYRPLNLEQALIKGYISSALRNTLKEKVSYRCNKVGFNCSFLKDNDFLLVLKPNNELLMENDGYPEMRICNFELIKKMH